MVKKSNTLRCCVYVHTNKINGKKYIGITSQKPEARWGVNGSRYLYEDTRTKSAFAKALHKYGWENFTHEILFEGLTEAEAKQKERELITKYRTYVGFKDCAGYNMTLGGDGAPLYETEEERKAAIKASQQKCAQHLKQSEEYREKMRKYYTELAREKRKDPEYRATKNAYMKEYYKQNKDKYKSYSCYMKESYYNKYVKGNQEAIDARNAQRNERRRKIKEIRAQLIIISDSGLYSFSEEELKLIFEKYPGTRSYKCEHLPKLEKLLAKAKNC